MILDNTDIARIYRLLSQYRLQIRSNMMAAKKWVTGKTWAATYVYVSANRYELDCGLKSSSPIAMKVQETGRGPGYIPKDFKDTIYQWSLAKGIPFKSDKERWKFAGAIAFNKIRKYGTKQFRDGSRDDIFTKPWNNYEQKLDEILKGSIVRSVKKSVSFL